MEITDSILIGASTGLGIILKSIFDFFKEKRNDQAKIDLDAGSTIVVQYQEFVATLKARIDELEAAMNTLQQKVDDLNEEHSRCRAENAKLKNEIKHLSNEIEQLKRTNTRNGIN